MPILEYTLGYTMGRDFINVAIVIMLYHSIVILYYYRELTVERNLFGVIFVTKHS